VLDIRLGPRPFATGPTWTVADRPRPGLGIDVDEAKIAHWHANYRRIGQYLPYQPDQLASEDPDWPGRDRPGTALQPT